MNIHDVIKKVKKVYLTRYYIHDKKHFVYLRLHSTDHLCMHQFMMQISSVYSRKDS